MRHRSVYTHLKGVLNRSPILKVPSPRCEGYHYSFSTGSSVLTSQTSNIKLSYKSYPPENEGVDSTKAPLVFLHGLFGAKGNLHSVSKHLSSGGRRVVTFDARNHGSSTHVKQMDFLSMAQDLHDLIGQLGMEKPAVMGHSMGGKTAMTFALQNPGKISSLIIEDIAPIKSPEVQVLVGYAKAMKNVEIPQKDGLTKARKKVEVKLAPVVADRSILSFLLTNLIQLEDGSLNWRFNLDAFLNNHEAIGSFPKLDFQPFTKPTLFIFGDQSTQFRDADKGQIKAMFPNAQVETIPNAGHFVHSEKPIEFVGIVQDFFKSLESGK